MAQRPLQRFNLGDEILQKLNAAKIYTPKDLLSKGEIELMQLADLDRKTVKEILLKVSLGVAPKPTQLTVERRNAFFQTSMAPLDRALHGGLAFSTISEIVGPSGCGKTQFCLTLSVAALLPKSMGGLEGKVIYLDTENAFSAKRLVEIAKNRFPHYFKDEQKVINLTKSVLVSFVQTTEALLAKLGSMEEEIIANQVKLIVLDSVASLVRKEFRGNMMERTDVLAREASILKYLSASFKIPVVVTNQVTTRFDVPVGFERNRRTLPEGDQNFVVAALGNTWSHAVNTRLVLEFAPAHLGNQAAEIRKIKITKSPIAAFSSFLYKIEAGGITILETLPQQAAEEYDDPMEMITINSRSSIALEAGRF